jgi:hypothetical protein
MRRIWVAGAAALYCLALGGGMVSAASVTPLGFNISMDSGAEAARAGRGKVVPIPLWRTTSTMTAVKYGAPGFPSKAVAQAAKGENNFFYCGRRTARSRAIQRIPIYGRNRLIDRGRLKLRAAVQIGSDTTDGDAGRMVVRFLNRNGRTIGKLRTAKVQATGGLLPRIVIYRPVPKGTRAIRIVLVGTGTAGTSCDVFFDNVSTRLVRR